MERSMIAGRHRVPIRAILRAALAGILVAATPAWSGPAFAQEVEDPAGVTFDAPTAEGAFGEAVMFRTHFEAEEAPVRVELVTRLPGERATDVTVAAISEQPDGGWEAAVAFDGHIMPNTLYRYRFRAVTDAGDVLGPEAEHRVVDDRVAWRSVTGDGVRLSWHEGDDAFAERALGIAEEALASASDLLGSERGAPVDVFVYGDPRTFRTAMGPGTRENVGGQAHPAIRTLFGLIEPSQVGSDWVEELVRHELTHLVFDDAASSPFAVPPRWLNEGVAVYLAKGYDDGDRAQVDAAARAGTIIPLEGLAGQFPTRPGRFGLAYAESASAVAHLVDRYGDDALGVILDGYAAGLDSEAAFSRAIGIDMTTFAAEWLDAIGAPAIEPSGPRPAPPGPVPDAWRSDPVPLIR
jgi:Peptidase MA superfamily